MPRQEWVGIEPMGEVFLLTFLFIGLVRDGDFSSRWKVTHWKSVNTTAFELSRWRGGRCCMGFLRAVLAV